MESHGDDVRMWVKPTPSKLFEGLADPQKPDFDSPDSAIPAFLTLVGFAIEGKSPFVSSECVCAFLASHLCFVDDVDPILFRLTGSVPSRKIVASRDWIDARTPTGTRKFSALFWTRLLYDIECFASKEFLESFPAFAAYEKTCGYYIHPTEARRRSALFALVFSANLKHKNILDLASDKDFMSLIGGWNWIHASIEEKRRIGDEFVRCIEAIDARDEELWVSLFATSTFRKTPFVYESFATATIPRIERIERAKAEEQWAAIAKRNLEAEEQERKKIAEAKEPASAVGACIHTETESAPKILPPPPVVFSAYPSIPLESEEFFAHLLLESETKRPSQGRIAAIGVTFPAGVKEIMAAYEKAAGFAGMPSARFVAQSMMVSLLGGSEATYTRASEVVLAGKPVAKPESRSVLANISPNDLDWILRKLVIGEDQTEAVSYPQIAVEEITAFKDAMVGKIKPEDIGSGIKTAMRMYLTIHYDTQTWKSRWIAGPNFWTLNTNVTEGVDAMLVKKPRISPTMRAFLISSSVSMM